MNQNQAKEYYEKLFVNYPDVLSVEEATTLPEIQLRPPDGLSWAQPVSQRCDHAESGWKNIGALCGQHRLQGTAGVSGQAAGTPFGTAESQRKVRCPGV